MWSYRLDGETNKPNRKEKAMKKYMVYMDDGRDCFKASIPANSEKEVREYVEGNGEVIAIKDVTHTKANH